MLDEPDLQGRPAVCQRSISHSGAKAHTDSQPENAMFSCQGGKELCDFLQWEHRVGKQSTFAASTGWCCVRTQESAELAAAWHQSQLSKHAVRMDLSGRLHELHL